MNRLVGNIDDRYEAPDLLMPYRAAEFANDSCIYIRGDRFREETDTHTPKLWTEDQPTTGAKSICPF